MKIVLVSLLFVASAIAKPHPHVIGGVEASLGQFPYQVSFQINILNFPQAHFCGGSIISPTWVVTAGHCVILMPDFAGYHVVAGIVDLTANKTENIRVVDKVIYPDFHGILGPYDIALLKLETPFEFNDNVQPIKLPESQEEFTGNVNISGWGAINNNPINNMPDILHSDVIPLLTIEECRTALVDLFGDVIPLDDDLNVCTGPLDGGKGTCSGDSGGPIAQDGKLVGIVSYGITPCGTVGAPSMYTKVSKYIDFIKENVDDLPQ